MFPRIRREAIAVLAAIVVIAGEANADPADMTVDRLLDICTAPDTQAAALKGDALGWTRMTDAETSGWRRSFESHNAGSVNLVGWKRDGSEGSDTLSFWVAVGNNGHQACAYSTRRSIGLLDSLKRRLGAPDYSDRREEIESTSASWRRGGVAYAFTQIGSSAVVNISRDR